MAIEDKVHVITLYNGLLPEQVADRVEGTIISWRKRGYKPSHIMPVERSGCVEWYFHMTRDDMTMSLDETLSAIRAMRVEIRDGEE